MDAMRASGLIPVNPLIVINKDTQLPMYIEGRSFTDALAGYITAIYTNQILYTLCTVLYKV